MKRAAEADAEAQHEWKRARVEEAGDGCKGTLYVCANGLSDTTPIYSNIATPVFLRDGEWCAVAQGNQLVLTQTTTSADALQKRAEAQVQAHARANTLAALRADVAVLRADALAMLERLDEDSTDNAIVPTLRHQRKALLEAEAAHEAKQHEPLTVTTRRETRTLALEPGVLHAIFDHILIWQTAALREPNSSVLATSVSTQLCVNKVCVSSDRYVGVARGLTVWKEATFLLQHDTLFRLEGQAVLQHKSPHFKDGPAAIWTNGTRVYVTGRRLCV
jgi:hypothetical protein